jgi:hypothetical protein
VAILDEANLAAEAAKRATYRVNHVGTKLNESELRAFEALAAKRNQTQGELIRGLILNEQAREAGGIQPSAELMEITGVRLLLINLLKPVAIGQPMTEKESAKKSGVRRGTVFKINARPSRPSM